MVPSRSRNTAARKREGSGTLSLYRREPGFCGGLYHLRRDGAHATMVARTMAEKTGAAIRFLLNNRVARSHGSCAVRISRPKHGNYGQAYTSRHVHRSRIIADEEMALRKQGGKVGNRSFLCEVDGRSTQFGRDGSRDSRFGCRSEKNNLSVAFRLQPIGERGKARWRPAF